MKTKIKQLINSRGNTVINQLVITSSIGTMFQSYGSAIALIDTDNTVHLSPHWDYSTTTSKYRNQFLNKTTKETKDLIDAGIFKMDLSSEGKLL